MQAVILAAGEGKRMHPLTLTRPKPLIEILGKSLLAHILEALPADIDNIIIVVGYKADQIQTAFGHSYNGTPITYVTQDQPKGTLHALALAAPFITGRFLLLNSDDIHGKEALDAALAHPLALLVANHQYPERFGVVSLAPDGSLGKIIEKPELSATNLISTGAMVLDERIFQYPVEPAANGEYYLPVALAQLARDHKVAIVTQDLWIPVGYPEDIPEAESTLRSSRH